MATTPRTSDLTPPLGYPGGPCHVVRRIMEEVRSPKLRDELIEDVELGLKLTNPQAAKIYDVEKERGAGRVKQFLIGRHAQYRMDQRGVAVTEIRMALKSFSDTFERGRSLIGQPVRKQKLVQIQSLVSGWMDDMARGEPIRWVDPKIKLAVVFSMGRGAANVITVYWEGQSDPRAPGEGTCPAMRSAYTPPVSKLPGTQTYVTDPDKGRGPGNTDKSPEDDHTKRQLGPSAPENKQQALPIPPNHKKQRDIQVPYPGKQPSAPAFSAPPSSKDAPNEKTIHKDKMRTRDQEGEEYGHPHIDQGTGLFHRRTMKAADVVSLTNRYLRHVTAGLFKLYPAGNERQRRQKGSAKIYYKRYYRKKRAKIKMRAKIRYKRIRKRGKFQRDQKMRRKYPRRYARKPGGGYMRTKERRKDYDGGKTRTKLKNKKKAQDGLRFFFHEYEGEGSLIGITPDGVVSFLYDGEIYDTPLDDFFDDAEFYSEEDIEYFLSMVDEVLGYDGPDEDIDLDGLTLEALVDMDDLDIDDLLKTTPDNIHDTADLFGVSWDDDPAFMEMCKAITGESHLDSMSPDQLDKVQDAILGGFFQSKQATFHREQINPSRLKQNWRRKNRSKGAPEGDDENAQEHEGLPSWVTPMSGKPGLIEERENRTPAQKPEQPIVMNNPGSAKVIPSGYGFVNKKAYRMAEIVDGLSTDIVQRSQGLGIKLRRVDAKNLVWLYDVQGSQGPYRVRFKAIRKARNIRDPKKVDVKVSCSCNFWRWQGPEYWAKQRGYLFGRPVGTASKPNIKDPSGTHGACKHVLAVLRKLKGNKYFSLPAPVAKRGSKDGFQYLSNRIPMGRVEPDYGAISDAIEAVARRFMNED